MITELTEKQKAKMPEWAAKWIAHGLSTAPCDEAHVEKTIARAYRAGGLKPPRAYVWCDSPYALVVTHACALGHVVFGNQETWLSFYDYFREVVGLRRETRKLAPLLELGRSVGWFAPYQNVCYISRRPTEIHLDGAGRLHALDGPAIRYADGWGLYCVHGVHVPKEWVTARATLPVTLALTEPNIERRAAAAELIGWDKVLAELPTRVLNEETTPTYDYGRLLAVRLPDTGSDSLFLQVRCPTGRTMVLPVPPEMRTAREANAFSYGFSVAEFRPEFRT